MKTLVIAEKPSQAREYAQALGGFLRKDGFLENDRYYITWCFGHLVELAKDTAYREGTKWDISYLPLIPTDFKYIAKGDAEVKKRLQIIKELMNKSSAIINATDADREGETIFLYVYNYLNCNLPYLRLWVNSLTEEHIRKQFSNLLTSKDVYNLGRSGYARAITDWLVGVNATQAVTLHIGKGELLTIGRVQTSILKIICERYLKNKSHQKTYTYKIRTWHKYRGIEYYTDSPIYETEKEVDAVISSLEKNHTFISSEKKIEKKNAPLLFSINTLTIEANKYFGLDADKVLASAQRLYEAKLTTYPRTDSQYINIESFSNLKKKLPAIVKNILGVDFKLENQNPKCVNEQKITGSHDALVITGDINNYERLSNEDKKMYALILSKCMEAFSNPAVYEKIKYNFENNDTPFVAYSSELKDLGWKKYTLPKHTQATEDEDEDETEDVVIKLDLQSQEKVFVERKEQKNIESKPKAIYTPATLTKDLTNIGKFLQDENPELLATLKKEIDLKEVGIGTEATRPSILKRLEKVGYISNEKNKYIPTDKGLKFYNLIKNLQVSNIANIGILEKQLKDISEGNLSEEQFYSELNSYVREVVKDIFSLESKVDFKERNILGTCPKCRKGNIIEGKKGFGCTRWKEGCDFVLWKKVAGKRLTKKNIQDLLEKGQTTKINGFKGRNGEFKCKLVLSKSFKTEFEF